MKPSLVCSLFRGLLAAVVGLSVGVSPASPPQVPAKHDLKMTVEALVRSTSGTVGVAIRHVETGDAIELGAMDARPLFSVFKFPLCVAVLKEVEQGRLSLDQKVTVVESDRSTGVAINSERWRSLPQEVSVRQLIRYAMVYSDNTASDKLMSLLGGPAKLTKRLRNLGVRGIQINLYTREMATRPTEYNRGSAAALAELLSRLQRGQILRAEGREMLFALMRETQTGANRLRGALPPGTDAWDKTGTGENGSVTNDVGIIALPDGQGHLALAVLISSSALSSSDQERVISRIGRAAYDAYSTRGTGPSVAKRTK